MKTQTLFSGKWVQTAPLTITEPTRPELRGTQPQAFKALKDKQHVILNAPTGWGKSVVIAFLVAYKLARNPQLRCIIAVPQTVIARGFVKDWKLRVAGALVDWFVQHNLCHTQATNTIACLIQFLRGGHTSMADRILICTHATLAHTYKRLKKCGQLGLLTNTIVWIDEAHHVMNAQVARSTETVSNILGAFIKDCITHESHVGLATATFQRGDMRHILPEALEKKFTRVSIPYDVYLRDMQPVESFEFNVVCGDTLKALDSIFKKVQPTILYLAKRNSRYAGRCKYLEVEQIVKCLGERLQVPVHREDDLIRVGELKVLDLVTEKGRESRKAYLDEGGKVDIIIALDTCKEGFDWPEAERSIILGERHSIPEMIQMIGRLFRRAEGKTHAEVYQILPAAIPNSQQFKDQRNAILTVIFSAMLLEDVFLPLGFSTVPEKGKHDRTDRIVLAVPDTEVWQALMRDFLVAAQGRSYKESWQLAPSILKRHGIANAEWEFVWKKLWQRNAFTARKLKGLRLDVPFEVLKETDLAEGLLTLASGLCGAMTFQELRRVIGREKRTLEEWAVIAEKLTEKHGGVLPGYRWLIRHGCRGLANALHNHPHLFAQLKQQPPKTTYTPEEWAGIAERVAEEHGGVLPSPQELRKKGYRNLPDTMRLHPQLFAHIRQPAKTKHTPEEWVAVAERLAAEHRGVLPDPQELHRRGYGNLPNIMRLHPDLFAHIRQRARATREPQEWVAIAAKLAAEHGGTLPSPQELRKHGCACLVKVMNHNPQLFARIRQQRRLLRTPEEWTAVAEKLAQEHGGILPRAGQLQRCGYKSLTHAMHLHPELFSHIKQQRRIQCAPEEWVAVAEKLAEEHGGTLPDPKQLRENGYKNLVYALHQRPQLFAHVERNRRARRSLNDLSRRCPELAPHIEPGRKNLRPHEWVRVAEHLAATHGTLPGNHWLKTSGYLGLWHAQRKHPDLFAHIPNAASTHENLVLS